VKGVEAHRVRPARPRPRRAARRTAPSSETSKRPCC